MRYSHKSLSMQTDRGNGADLVKLLGFSLQGAGMAQWREHSPPTSVFQVRFRLGVICGLNLLLVHVLAPRIFLRILRFSSPYKNQHFKFQFNLEAMDEEPNRGICPCKFLFIVIYLFTLLLLLLLLFFFYKTPSSMHQCSKPSAFVTQKKKTLVVECFIM